MALPELQANIDGSMEVFTVLRPSLEAGGQAAAVQQILDRREQLGQTLARLGTEPGYLGTGYPSYTKVTLAERRILIAAVVALAEALSKLSALVG